MPLSVGSPAPAFSLSDQNGTIHSLSDYTGRWLVLYFYPKDDTPGCTTEACGFRDRMTDFTNANVAVLGVSADTEQSHGAFAEKFHLSFPLLADTERKTVADYGVWVEKNLYGKKSMGIARTTFVIDPQGNIAKTYEKVQPENHEALVLADLGKLQS